MGSADLNSYLLAEDQNIDRRQCKRVVPLEVLSLGMSRTGTGSMKAALHQLGYDEVAHFFTLFSNIRDVDIWVEAIEAKYQGKGKPFGRAEWDSLLGHCAAVTDAPCTLFAPELIAAYPEAKVVLVEREYKSWFKSFCGLVDGIHNLESAWYLAWLDPGYAGKEIKIVSLWIRSLFHGETLEEVKDNAKGVYEEYYATIRRITPKERLLEYKLGDGWEPLCTFLNKPLPSPDVPFPRINDKEQLDESMQIFGKKAMGRIMRSMGWVVGPILVAGVGSIWFLAS